MVLKGIETLVGRSGRDWQIAGKAGNGKEALALLETEDVDLVITDIMMPDMNGIEMIEEMARLGLTCECLILTSYPDFEFARKAVKFGALNYLLKPVDPDELIDNIAQAEQAVESRKRHLIEQEQITRNRQLMTNMMFARLLFGYDHDESKVRRELEQAGLRIGELAVVTAAQPDWMDDARWGETKRGVASVLGEEAGIRAEDVSFEERFLVLAVWTAEGAGLADRLEAALADIAAAAQTEQTGKGPLFGLSEACSKPADIAAALNQSICNHDWAVRTGRPVVRFRDVDENDHMIQYPYALEHKLLFAFKSGQLDDVHRLTEQLAEGLFETNRLSNLYHIVMISSRTLAAFKRLVVEMNSNLEQIIRLDADAQAHPLRFTNMDTVKAWFLQSMAHITEQIVGSRKFKSRKIIEQVKTIVAERYATDIQIRDIADELYMNASYLSDLFKQTTGMTFTEFVIEHRLQQAKALLLRDPQAKLYEIAEKVGYKNPKHFSQLFKKHVGVLPGEFRELR